MLASAANLSVRSAANEYSKERAERDFVAIEKKWKKFFSIQKSRHSCSNDA